MRTVKLVLVSVLFGGLAAIPAAAEKYALLVGINDYMYDDGVNLTDLNGCVNDVLLVQRMLTASFDFKADNIRVLLSREATAENVRRAFREHLIEKSKPGDWIVFSFSGHGTQIRDFNGDEQGEDEKDEILLTTEMNPSVSVSTPYPFIVDDELGAMLDELKGRTVLVLLDCCHSGTATRGITPGRRGPRRLTSMAQCRGVFLDIQFEESGVARTRGAGTLRGAGAPEMPPEVVVCTAAADHQEAMDYPFPLTNGDRKSNGAFTYYLAEGLRGPADADRSGRITLEEMFNYAQRALKDDGFAQDPTFTCPRGLRNATFFGEQQLPPGAMNVADVKKDERFQVAQAAHDQAQNELEAAQAALAAVELAEKEARRAEKEAEAAAKAAQRAEAAAVEAQSSAKRAEAGASAVKEAATKALAGPSQAVQAVAELSKQAQASQSQANAAAERARHAAGQAKTLAEGRPASATRTASQVNGLSAAAEAAQEQREEAAAAYDLAKERLALAEREKEALDDETRKALDVVKEKLAKAEGEQQRVQAVDQEKAQHEAALSEAEQGWTAAREMVTGAEADLAATTEVARQIAAQAKAARDAAQQAAQAAAQAAQNGSAAHAETEKVAGAQVRADWSVTSQAIQAAADAVKQAEQAAAEAATAAKQADAIRAQYDKNKGSAKLPVEAKTAEKELEQHVSKARASATHAAALVQSARQQLASAKAEEDAAKTSVARARAMLAELQKSVGVQAAQVRAADEKAAACQAAAEQAAADAGKAEETVKAAVSTAQSKVAEASAGEGRANETAAAAAAAVETASARLEAARTAAAQAAAELEAAKGAAAEQQANAQVTAGKLAESQAGEAQAAGNLATAAEDKERLAKTQAEAEAKAQEARKREEEERKRMEIARLEQERLQKEAGEAARREQERLEKERQAKEAEEAARAEKMRREEEAKKAAAEAAAAAEAERIEKERLQKEADAAAGREQERLEQEKAAKEAEKKAQEEKKRLEQDRIAQDNLLGPKLTAAKLEKQRLEEARAEEEKRRQDKEEAGVEAAAAAEAARLDLERIEQEERTKAEAEKKKREELAQAEAGRKPDEVTIPMGSHEGVTEGSVFAVFPAGGSLDNPTGKIKIVAVGDGQAVGHLIEGTIGEDYAVQCIFEPAPSRNLYVSVEGEGPAYDAVLKSVKSMPNVELRKDYEADRRVLVKADGTVDVLNPWGDVVRPSMSGGSIDALAYDVKQQLTMTYFGRQLADMRNPNPPFRLELRTLPEGKNVLAYEEEVQFEVTCSTDARIVILFKDSAGDIDMLFPNEFEPGNIVKAGIPRCFPNPAGDIEIVADEPTGEVLYKVFAFALDQEIEETFRAEYSGERELKMLMDQLKATLFQPGAHVRWAETSAVQEYRW